MRIVRTFLSLLALVSTLVEGKSATGQRVLVIVEHAINRADYSQFWDSLQGGSARLRTNHQGQTDLIGVCRCSTRVRAHVQGTQRGDASVGRVR